MRQAWEPSYGFTSDTAHGNVELALALEVARRKVCAYGSKGVDTCDCKYGVDTDTRSTSEKTGCPELRELINRLLHRPESLVTDEMIETRLIDTTRSLRQAAGIPDEEVEVDLVARVDRLRQAAEHEVVVLDGADATIDRIRRSWGMRYHELLAAEELLDGDDATSVVAVFETLLAEMVPVLHAETVEVSTAWEKAIRDGGALEREVRRLRRTEEGACVRQLHAERLMERQEQIADLTSRLEVKHNAWVRAEMEASRLRVGIPLPHNGFPRYRVGNRNARNLYQVNVEGETHLGITCTEHAGPLVVQALNDWEAVRQRGGALGDERWLLAVLWQHVEWANVTRELETPHRELWADIVDASGAGGAKADRWWREGASVDE